jgi:tRNA dimethylallyltransferase
MNPTMICLMGPTASGKTDLAIKLIQHLPCEIISVDSAMIYRGMDIGTAKPSADILKEAPHRLLDIRDPSEKYSAGDFREDALQEINQIISAGKIPLLVGGTMLYFHTLQNGLAALPKADPEIREMISQKAQTQGWMFLHEELKKIDPVAAQRIHPNDPQRLQRALEVYEATGKTLTQLIEESSRTDLPFQFLNFALVPNDKNTFHETIKKRFEIMLKQGFIEEVEKLFHREDLSADLPSIRSVGYRQIWEYLSGEINLETMKEKGIAATRQLAKRQMTWLRSWKSDLRLFEMENKNKLNEILEVIARSEVI